MSHLGDQIRGQVRVAQRVQQDLQHDAQEVRRRVHSTVWESSAGGFFKDRLGDLIHDLEAAQDEVGELVRALERHATSAEQHQASIEEWLGSAAHETTHALSSAGHFVSDHTSRAVHAVEDAVGSATSGGRP